MAKAKLLDIDSVFEGFEIDERKINQSTASKLRMQDQKYRDIVSKHRSGSKASEETKEKMKQTQNSPLRKMRHLQTHLGLTHSDETKKKISDANVGRVKSKETSQKISNAKKGIPMAEEHRRNMIAAKSPRIYQTPLGLFTKQEIMAAYPDTVWMTLYCWCAKNKPGFSKIKNEK
jgi:hypothetical protein